MSQVPRIRGPVRVKSACPKCGAVVADDVGLDHWLDRFSVKMSHYHEDVDEIVQWIVSCEVTVTTLEEDIGARRPR